jgi:hypothetical protein
MEKIQFNHFEGCERFGWACFRNNLKPQPKNTNQGNSSKTDLSPPSETFRVAGIIETVLVSI